MAKGNTIPAKELRTRGDAELKSMLASKLEELTKSRFKHALGQLRNPHTLGALKREVARIETVLKERAIKGAAQGETAAKSEVSNG